MNDNINMNSATTASNNDNISMGSTIARSMNDNIHMDMPPLCRFCKWQYGPFFAMYKLVE